MRSEEQFSSVTQLADHLRFLLDRGVTTVDTANTYGQPYTVEEFLGKALKEVGRDKFEVITKAGIRRLSPLRPDNRVRHFDFSREELTRSFDRSLQKLGVDHVDVLLLHRPDYLMEPAETAAVLDEFVAAGKTRYVGVSNFNPSRYELLAGHMKSPLVTNQVEFSARHLLPISNGTFDLAMRVGHVPMIWSPVGGGALFNGTEDRTIRIRNRLTAIAERTQRRGGAFEAAIAFVARHPARGIPIIGSGKRDRLDDAIRAVNNPLDRQDWYEVIGESNELLEI
jgi:predicted oxidoreductase